MLKVLENLYLYKDTCNVYVIKNGEQAVLVDFGSGGVLEHLEDIGITTVTDVLLTHHHRDQAQGLEKIDQNKIHIWVPHMEQDLFKEADHHWQGREIYNNYNMREDRFSILNSISITGTLKDYSTYTFAGYDWEVLPTPGHTIGSISLLVNVDGNKVGFTGDLIFAPGKVWSLAATQWSYNGAEGVPYSILSLLSLKEKTPSYICPSHGEIMTQPASAIDVTVEALQSLLNHRKQSTKLLELRNKPYRELLPHLLKNRTSWAHSYVVLSESGKALIIDYGYDFMAGMALGTDRAARRPWLYNIEKLKKDYGVEKIDVALLTHFHDDHVGGLNVLRDVEGTQVWAAENFADILERPAHYDLPCLWYDPIKVDRKVPLNRVFQWEEYEFTLYEQSGHTLYAVAIDFEVDGQRVLAIGDQYQETSPNYVYKNDFRIWDYKDSAALYNKLKPDLLISGHSEPIWLTEQILQDFTKTGEELERIHRNLLPEGMVLNGDGSLATLSPYQKMVQKNETFTLTAVVKNPYSEQKSIVAALHVPEHWGVHETAQQVTVSEKGLAELFFSVTAPDFEVRRARIAVDVTIGDEKFGQQAEALVTISSKGPLIDEVIKSKASVE
ncbi:glyoxylase-like metal-dependent hydrolase (beta-lactamase superfamily II) [Pullulanibacillus pueri]|uniref:Metallo-beta-lactamase domain-containing protein n=1 Tax=Pullulanibacillus pueri TaxID=1437324 RepID=A0A8J3EJW2_9BACL|nr:MBL fold metallo-hydrolase [Pullulanibacillus pueri]MBM7679898.1 glyoxylase-like metal-dependent hydrolase (beta-lactamase superfamily II) [Pullulanibacillus pueri]GGH73382.1 hypothetical protein GCM10007096_00560 [Pullulanibacillus pueri]